MKGVVGLIFFGVWVAGVVISKGFWSCFFAIFMPFWAWYLVIEMAMIKYIS
jgi:hypothetical protein